MAHIEGMSTVTTKEDVGSGRDPESPQGGYFPEDDGEKTRRRSCVSGRGQAEEEAGLL